MCIRDRHHTAASHELLDALRLGAGVVVAVAFHEVDNTPHREAGTEMCIRARCYTGRLSRR